MFLIPKKSIYLYIGLFILLSCKSDLPFSSKTKYPDQVNTIITTRCATTGCHDAKSNLAAGGLNLESWQRLFQGGRGGSVVIPFRSDRSWLHYYTNTYDNLGISLSPTMPIGGAPLSREEVLLLKNWIDRGAPDDQGNIAFCCNPNRPKYYITNQGCDEVSVFDAESNLVMRYINVGNNNSIESPHYLMVSADGRYLYTVLRFGNVVQKFDANTDQFVADCFIDNADWNVIVPALQGRLGIISDLSPDGKIRIIDLNTMTILKSLQGLVNPHGLYYMDQSNTLYVTSQFGNSYYKLSFDTTDFSILNFETLSLQPGTMPNFNPNTLDPHQIQFTPDESVYFITCQASNEVRAYKTQNDSLLAIIPVGTFPLEMAVSKSLPYLAVTCEETTSTIPRTKGSISIINYETLQVIGTINQQLFQPHGIAIDDIRKLIIVTNRNKTTDGPAPHHSSECGGRNGFISYFSLSDFSVLTKMKTEVSVDPYSIAIRP